MGAVVTVTLDGLACARITRLVTTDSLLEGWRVRRRGRVGELVSCPWCTGVWVAVAWTLLRVVAPGMADRAARALTVAWLAGRLGGG